MAAAVSTTIIAADDVIKIGAVLPMTGNSAVFGKKFQQAIFYGYRRNQCSRWC